MRRQREQLGEGAALAKSASDDEEAVEQSDAVKQALHREQVAQPTETSADGTDSVNKTIRKGKKIGRNDPCPCGGGKKYKKSLRQRSLICLHKAVCIIAISVNYILKGREQYSALYLCRIFKVFGD